MKYLIVLADGAADEPVEELGYKTPLQAANKPIIDRLAREGVNGRLVTVPEGYHPGSEIAHLGLLGYDVSKVFEGRGSLEAASMQVPIDNDEVAMRCNVICLKGDNIKNHSSGNISTEEANELLKTLNEKLPTFTLDSGRVVMPENIRFFTGVSYRHLLKIRGGNKHVNCTPPHDRIGKPWRPELPKTEYAPINPCEPITKLSPKETADLLCKLILWSQSILADHPVNLKRIAEGKDPANSIWPWSLGYRPKMQTFMDLFPNRIHSGAVISAVDLIFGIGVYCGLDKVEVPGTTGLWDTNFEGKADATIEQLKQKDFVFLHIEATDEAGHDGEAELKKNCVEYINDRVLSRIVAEVEKWAEPVRIAILPDHPTPIKYRTHTMTPVPFLIWQSKPGMPGDPADIVPDTVECYDEDSAAQGALGLMKGDEFIRFFLGENK